VRVSRLVGRILLGTGPCGTGPEQPSISARRRRRTRATYPQTPAGRRLAASSGIVCAGARPKPGALLVLLRVGFTQPPRSPEALVVSYTTVSPLPAPRPSLAGAAGGLSLWHFPASHLGWALPTTVPCGVRTFLGRSAYAHGRGCPVGSPAHEEYGRSPQEPSGRCDFLLRPRSSCARVVLVRRRRIAQMAATLL
jgi:hypothetical protein